MALQCQRHQYCSVCKGDGCSCSGRRIHGAAGWPRGWLWTKRSKWPLVPVATRQFNDKISVKSVNAASTSSRFSKREIQFLYSEFKKASRNRKKCVTSHIFDLLRPRRRMAATLSPQELLGLFSINDALDYVFAERFFGLFWRRSQQWSALAVSFNDFLSVYGLWCRGTPDEKMILIFRLYDRGDKGYIDIDDIVDIHQSVFLYYLAKTSLLWVSSEFKAKAALKELSKESLLRLSADVMREEAAREISLYHADNTHTPHKRMILWYSEFCRWIIDCVSGASPFFVTDDQERE